MVVEFHQKFQAGINEQPALISEDRSDLRYKLMQDEVAEYKTGVEKGDLSNVVKELADVLYAVYGTIIEHGPQDKMADIFSEVHRSNMSKEYGQYKMIKGEKYQEADVDKFL